MNGGEILGWISICVTLLLGLLVWGTNHRANRTSEKKLTLEEQTVADAASHSISEERRVELERLYTRVDKLERIVEELQRADKRKQRIIGEQADELDATNRRLTQIRTLFSAFVSRVEQAWKDGHTMPTLTPEERALLEGAMPIRDHNKGGSQ